MRYTKVETTFSLFPLLIAAVLLLAACVMLSGCYTLKQGSIMLGYLSRAVPLESLPKTAAGGNETEIAETEKILRFVELIGDIRRFAMEELGLKISKNYTRYVQIDRDYLAAVVSASAADSFTRYEWRYPVVGSMPYKGFFNVEDARRERAKLEKKGLDVWIRGVDAFSTLGWFRDPLYSYMRDYSPDRLAELIIHESLHATVFLKGQAQFNEELAEFVGSEGARLYTESRFGIDSDEYQTMIAAGEDYRRYTAFIRELIAELQVLYKSEKEQDEKLREKERIIGAAKERFDAEYESRFSGAHYRGFSDLPVNNAYLDLYRLYSAEDAYIADLYRESGEDLRAFIAAAKAMPKKGKTTGRERLTNALKPE
ncbi:MAG: aminopeptidase [Treponema sp.]|jgi:predicted aminopeptidase|nr:aminopeptidase [Treponema sp.]